MKGCTTVVGTVLSIAIGLLAVSSVLRRDSDRESMAAKIKVKIAYSKYILSILFWSGDIDIVSNFIVSMHVQLTLHASRKKFLHLCI